ncbi:redoxin domain-containing protein [Corallincola platygyrae]|uniref:Redoxin domain-containing protein n=1 Tax=Corallincola platygyrae TaxID=1193278 RepID=A0ABW4XIZ1_9GAMM
MFSNKLKAGAEFPSLVVPCRRRGEADISKPEEPATWRMIVVYRGRHCPLCTRYLNELEGYVDRLNAIDVDLAVVSGDSEAQLREHMSRLDVTFPIYHGLSIQQMESLGLYISHPRSEQETDHPFPEPGLFVINEKGTLQVVDISNNPFVRPNLESLVSGLEWIRKNDYPIRGTYPD